MLLTLLEILWWMQPEPTTPGDPTGPGGPPGGACATQVGLLAVMVAVFYFLLIRPQQKRERERDQMLKGLKKGSIVRTQGGIRGEITDLNDRDVTLMIADKVKINVLRSHIIGPEPEPGASPADKTAKDKKE